MDGKEAVDTTDQFERRSMGSLTVGEFLMDYNLDFYFGFNLLSSDEYKDAQYLKQLIGTLFREKKHEFKKAFRLLACIGMTDNRVEFEKLMLFQVVCLTKEANLVEKYLQQGMDVNMAIEAHCTGEYAGYSALHLALSQLRTSKDGDSLVRTVDLLLKSGAEVNSVNRYGDTPLHILMSRNLFSRRLFELLMDHGADDRTSNYLGETPFEILLDSSAPQGIEIYVESHGSVNHFNTIDRTGCLAKMLIIRRMPGKYIALASDIMQPDKQRRTAFHNLVSLGTERLDKDFMDYRHIELLVLMRYLKKKGIDINHQDDAGETALHYAVKFRNEQGVRILLSLGADIRITDVAGKTPLDISRRVASKNITEILTVHMSKLALCARLEELTYAPQVDKFLNIHELRYYPRTISFLSEFILELP